MKYVIIQTIPEVHLIEKDGKTLIFDSKIDVRKEKEKYRDCIIVPLVDLFSLLEELKLYDTRDSMVKNLYTVKDEINELINEIV